MAAKLKEKKGATVILPEKIRVREQIAPEIRQVIGQLVNGRLAWPWLLWGVPRVGKTCASLCMLDFADGRYWTADQWASDLNEARDGGLTEHTPAKTQQRVAEVRRTLPNGDIIEPGQLCVVQIEPARALVIKPADLYYRMKVAPLVVVDDVGQRKASEFQDLSLKRILDDRAGMPLVVISNREPKELGQYYSAPTAARLREGTVTEYEYVRKENAAPL